MKTHIDCFAKSNSMNRNHCRTQSSPSQTPRYVAFLLITEYQQTNALFYPNTTQTPSSKCNRFFDEMNGNYHLSKHKLGNEEPRLLSAPLMTHFSNISRLFIGFFCCFVPKQAPQQSCFLNYDDDYDEMAT